MLVFEIKNAESELWMQLHAQAMERCIVGNHRHDATTTTTPPRTTGAVFRLRCLAFNRLTRASSLGLAFVTSFCFCLTLQSLASTC